MPFITQVLLPKRDNLGRPFSREHYVAFHARMIRRFGGWTRKGQAQGAWLSPSGETFTDEHWSMRWGTRAVTCASGKPKRTTQGGVRAGGDLDPSI
jgi:hypothetical protein